MKINNKFTIKDLVVLSTDPDKLPRLVTGIIVRTSGLIYELSCGEFTSPHFEFEIELYKEDEL
jgi:hypothetical protein